MPFAFGDCTFDLEARELRRSGALVSLSPRAFELLGILLQAQPRAVPQRELKDHLWPDSLVGRTSLARLVTEVRKATGDTPAEPRFVRTHHGFGYSFCGDARAADAAKPAGVCRLIWGAREIPLGDGENVIGRAPDCRVRVDTPKTSRHHARIVVTGRRAVLEDLGSRNGTYLGARRIEGPTPLGSSEEIGIGTAVLTFCRDGTGSTETA
ncbi:MAG TPA: FHA domain-containing protein [Vicinamibacteria bacterium]|nr:FHA domain-containing protein [Vicinamibacteria bacterium]